MTDVDVSHFDHTSPAVSRELFETYRYLREKCPVAHSEEHGGFYVLSRYRDVVHALQNHRIFSSAHGLSIPHYGSPVRTIPTESDQPEHTTYRGVLMPFLTPAEVNKFEPFIREQVNALINEFIEHGETDIIERLARPLPTQVVSSFFDFTPEDAARCADWFDIMNAGSVSDPDAMAKAAGEFIAFLQSAVDAARARPAGESNPVIEAIVNGEMDGRPFTDEECVGLMLTSVVGAIETTTGALGHGVRQLALFPDARKQLIEDPSLMDRAVDEILRRDSPVWVAARTVLEPFELRDTRFEPGDRVLLSYGSANHDDDEFEDGEGFRLDREQNRHLTFGYGIHKCAGQHLARLEIKVAMEEILRRMPDYELAEDAEPVMRGGWGWGLSSLRIRFTPGPRV